MADVFEVKKYLPKCWLAVLPKYWYPTLPIDYPETTTVFSFVTGDDKVAMIEMEKNLGTEDSIISAEDVPEQEAVGAYLGTYDVDGEAGEEVLISPNKLPEDAIGALAYHYDAEADEWTLIDTVDVKDGYVYATLEEFSPIAVFALKRAAYLVESAAEQFPTHTGKVLVCNGVPAKIYRDDEDKIIAEVGSQKFELAETDNVVGGSLDGTDIESTSIYANGVKLNYLVGGSWTINEDSKNHTKSIKVTAKNCQFKILTGAGIWNCADYVEINAEGCKVTSGAGCQMDYFQKKSSNKTLADSAKLLGANHWVKKSVLNFKDTFVYVMYPAGNNGYAATLDSELTADNCEFTYFCNGQSNGTLSNVKSTLSNCKISIFNENNRGYWGNGSVYFKGGNVVDLFYLFGDYTDIKDAPTAQITGKVNIVDISATDTIKEFKVGSVGSQEAVGITDPAEAAKYVDIVKISRDANIIYADNADIVLKDIIRIK